jgi:hypothetical protein
MGVNSILTAIQVNAPVCKVQAGWFLFKALSYEICCCVAFTLIPAHCLQTVTCLLHTRMNHLVQVNMTVLQINNLLPNI